jgi:hypothetical protein
VDRFREFLDAALQRAQAPDQSFAGGIPSVPTFPLPSMMPPSGLFGLPSMSMPSLSLPAPGLMRGDTATTGSAHVPLSVLVAQKRAARTQPGGVSGSASAVAAPGSPPTPSGPAPVGTRDTVLRWLPQVSQVARQYDIPPELVLSIMHNESGGDPKAQSPYNPGQGYARGLLQVMPFHFKPGEDPFDPATNLDKGVKFMASMYHKYGRDPDKTMAAYFGGPGAIDAQGNIKRGLSDVNISVGNYIDKKFKPTFAAYQNYLTGLSTSGMRQAPAPSPVKVGKSTVVGGGLTPDQFNSGLSPADAISACGPAAAVAFARQNGRTPTVQEAVNLAKGVGWTREQGMAGPQSQVNLLKQMGVAASLTQGVDWNRVAAETSAGRPVIIDTPQHYWVAEGYDPASGRFNFGNSAKVLKATGGRTWLTAQEMAAINKPRSSIYLEAA